MRIELNRKFWERSILVLLFIFTALSAVLSLGYPGRVPFWEKAGWWTLVVFSASYGVGIFKFSNDREWMFALGMLAYAMPLLFFLSLMSYYFFSFGGIYFSVFTLLLSWLICQYLLESTPDD